MPRAEVPSALDSSQLLEELAAVEHERWAHWQRYVHDHCRSLPDGSLVIPPELVKRWAALIATPYSELSEAEKDSDREQVRRYLPIVARAIDS